MTLKLYSRGERRRTIAGQMATLVPYRQASLPRLSAQASLQVQGLEKQVAKSLEYLDLGPRRLCNEAPSLRHEGGSGEGLGRRLE
ncbi:hypothetical protein SKAU_G00155170 [Synaphobranchus kaupii]|uniref:Uncharacterized protein n=1 Tax=Synaphobranchus kaupii TaxID=118154 RepID=A0A9Q1FHV4_SYNKA|nr:hypothetical protein SKAU_G00155170 [Synaphobranchus kaupii]